MRGNIAPTEILTHQEVADTLAALAFVGRGVNLALGDAGAVAYAAGYCEAAIVVGRAFGILLRKQGDGQALYIETHILPREGICRSDAILRADLRCRLAAIAAASRNLHRRAQTEIAAAYNDGFLEGIVVVGQAFAIDARELKESPKYMIGTEENRHERRIDCKERR